MNDGTDRSDGHPYAPRRRRHRSCLATLGILILLLSGLGVEVWNLAVRQPWVAASARAAPLDARVPATKVNPYGVNTFLGGEVEPWKREKTMEMISAAGIGWIKQEFLWSEIEPSRGRHWDEKYQQDAWKKYDEIVALAERHGVRIIARLDHTPEWARPAGSTPNSPPTDPADYGRFVEEFVRHYLGRIQYIQIWNEPNLAAEWGGRVDPQEYATMLSEAATRARAIDPNIMILSAPMAMTNETSDRAMNEFDYWQRLYDLDCARYFDIMTATAYGLDQPPTAAPSRSTINLRRVELLHDLMVANGDGAKAVWLNEYGWNASPSDFPTDRLSWGRVSEDQQASWTANGISWMREHWPWMGVASIWYFRQNGDISPDSSLYYFRMIDLEFTPRQVYLAVQRDALSAQVALPGDYGETENPIVASGIWPRVEDDHATDGQYIRSMTEGSSIEIRFFGSDIDLLLPDTPMSGVLYMEIDGESAHDPRFERDDSGRAFIDLGAIPQGTDRLTVVSGFAADRPQTEHRLRLTLGAGSAFGLDGVAVRYVRSYRPLGAYAAIGVLAIVASMGLWRVTR